VNSPGLHCFKPNAKGICWFRFHCFTPYLVSNVYFPFNISYSENSGLKRKPSTYLFILLYETLCVLFSLTFNANVNHVICLYALFIYIYCGPKWNAWALLTVELVMEFHHKREFVVCGRSLSAGNSKLLIVQMKQVTHNVLHNVCVYCR